MKRLWIVLCLVLIGCVSLRHKQATATAVNAWKLQGMLGRGTCFPISCNELGPSQFEVLFLTADHIIDQQPAGWAVEREGTLIRDGMVLERNIPQDLAVVRVLSTFPIQCVTLRLDDEPAPGEQVYLAGYGGPNDEWWMQEGLACGGGKATVPTVMGDSGGPMIDEQGRVFGVAAAIEVVESFGMPPVYVFHHALYHPLCKAKGWLLRLGQRGLLIR